MLHGGDIFGKTIEHDFSVNLNPNPCPESVRKAMQEALLKVAQYPDISQRAFREAVAGAESCRMTVAGAGNAADAETGKIKAENVIGGNGASELLAAIVRYVDPKVVLLPVPSFWGYRHALGMLDECEIRTHRLTEENEFV